MKYGMRLLWCVAMGCGATMVGMPPSPESIRLLKQEGHPEPQICWAKGPGLPDQLPKYEELSTEDRNFCDVRQKMHEETIKERAKLSSQSHEKVEIESFARYAALMELAMREKKADHSKE